MHNQNWNPDSKFCLDNDLNVIMVADLVVLDKDKKHVE